MNQPSTQDTAVEALIQAKGKTAPRITRADIEAVISSEHFFTAADGMRFAWLTAGHSDPEQRDAVQRVTKSIPTRSYSGSCIDIDANANGAVRPELAILTFCVLVLRNGFTVTGESACASPDNFDAEIGRQIARDNAVQKVWPLLGYGLKEQLARQKPWGCASCCGQFAEMPTVCPHSTDGANGCNALLAKGN